MPKNTAFARHLRRKQTTPEAHLWTQLRRKKMLGLTFKRQVPIGPFIVDFFCHHALLIIEVDGEIHKYRQTYDRVREEYLKELGYVILRFNNQEVYDDLEDVLERIRQKTLSCVLSQGRGK